LHLCSFIHSYIMFLAFIYVMLNFVSAYVQNHGRVSRGWELYSGKLINNL
jgi:hypothetical protein